MPPMPPSPPGTIIWTRPQARVSDDRPLLATCPVPVLAVPVSRIEYDHAGLAQFLSALEQHYTCSDLVVVSSGVVAGLLVEHILPAVAPTITVACFGLRTPQVLRQHGFKLLEFSAAAARATRINSAQELLTRLAAHAPSCRPSSTWWYPRARLPAATIPTTPALRVREYVVYDHVPLRREQMDQPLMAKLHQLTACPPAGTGLAVALSSPLIYRSYLSLNLPLGHQQVVIGPTTARALRRDGLTPVVAAEPTAAALMKAAVSVLMGGSAHRDT